MIEFLGKSDRIIDTDLHITTIWAKLQVPLPDVTSLHQSGRILFEKYERCEDRISRYLQHCTTRRTDAKEWHVEVMYNEIEPLLTQVAGLLVPHRLNMNLQPVQPVNFVAAHPASTSVVTPTATVAVVIPSALKVDG